jgi:hypothetical protein
LLPLPGDKPPLAGLVQEIKILIVLESPAQGLQAGRGHGEARLGVRIIEGPPPEKILGAGWVAPGVLGPVIHSPEEIPRKLVPIEQPANQTLVDQRVVDALEAVGIEPGFLPLAPGLLSLVLPVTAGLVGPDVNNPGRPRRRPFAGAQGPYPRGEGLGQGKGPDRGFVVRRPGFVHKVIQGPVFPAMAAEILRIEGIKALGRPNKRAVRTVDGLPATELGNLEILEFQVMKGILEEFVIGCKILDPLPRLYPIQRKGV